MSLKPAFFGLCAALAPLSPAPAAGQAPGPAAPQASPNPFQGLWIGWSGVSRDSLEAETRQPDREAPAGTSIQAVSSLVTRSREEAEALGARVGEAVRGGDCAEGERIARAAGDIPLVQAVRDYCERRAAPR